MTALAAYNNSFTVPFIFDDRSIADTRELHQLWSLRPLVGTTRPLVQLSLALNYAIGGLDIVGYHAFNLTIHVLAAMALFGIVARTLRTPRLGARWNDAASSVALAASLVWTVHPLQTERVTYVVQRAESLMRRGSSSRRCSPGITSRRRQPALRCGTSRCWATLAASRG
jgi:hypothetical protein